MTLPQLISGNTVVKTFFGVSFNEKIDDKEMSVWLSNLLADNISQERSVRYVLFGPSILKLGLFAEDRSINERIKIFHRIAKEAIESKLASDDIKGTIL